MKKGLSRLPILLLALTIGLTLPSLLVSSFAQIELPDGNNEITFIKTVGFSPYQCGTTDKLVARIGQKVYYCYQITTGDQGITYYKLTDNMLGTIHNGYVYQQPDILIQHILLETIFTDTLNTAVLTATNSIHPSGNPFIASDTVTVRIPVAEIFLPTITH